MWNIASWNFLLLPKTASETEQGKAYFPRDLECMALEMGQVFQAHSLTP